MGQATSRRTNLLLLLFSLLSFCLHAQQGRLPLTAILKQLENAHSFRFSYLDEDVAGLTFEVDPSWSPEQVIRHIEEQSLLRFEEIESGSYTISTFSEIDLCGQILDNFARERMGGATVEILPGSQRVAADEDGYFRLERIPLKSVLKIRFLGFQPRFVPVTDFASKPGECLKILLAEEVQQLREVVVFPLLTSGIQSLEDGATGVSPSDFGLLPGLTDADVLQVLQALPGIESNQERISDLNIRGGTNAENLILWNGIKMYQSGHFFGLISAFQPRLTEQVIAYKNGTPAMYGDGVSGLIMMNSSPDLPEEHHGGGGFNLISADIYGRSPLGRNTGFEWSLRRSHTDLWESPVYKQYLQRAFQDSDLQQIEEVEEEFFFGDFSTRFYWDIKDQHQLRLNILGIQNRLESDSPLLGGSSTLKQDNLSFGGELTSEWTPALRSRLLVYQTAFNLEATTSDTLGVQALVQDNEVLERKLALQFVYTLSSRARVVAGYDFIETGVTNLTEVSQPPFTSRIKSVVFSEGTHAEFQVESRAPLFRGRVGVRLNAYNNLNTFTKVLIEPRLSVDFRLSRSFRLQLLGESKSQVTQQILDLEQNFLGIEKRRWVLSNETTLPVVSSEQLTLGLEYEKDEWYASLSLFSKEVSDTSTKTQGFQNYNQFSGEIGSYQVQGIEALANYRDRHHSHWISYAFNQNTYEFPDLIPSSFPGQQDVRHALSWGSTLRWDRWYAGIGGRWRSGRPYTRGLGVNDQVVPTRIDYEETNASRLPSYFRFDASASYRFPINRRLMATITASVLNFTDRRNVLERYFRIGEQEQLVQIDNYSLGLTPDLAFRLQF